jgi:ketosteroid isomerase-like protein
MTYGPRRVPEASANVSRDYRGASGIFAELRVNVRLGVIRDGSAGGAGRIRERDSRSLEDLMKIVLALSAVMCALSAFAQQRGAETPATIERADKAFADAMVKADLVALAQTYADDYVFTDPTGRVSHRAELLDSFKSGIIKIHSQEISDVQVHVYGNVAVEIGKLVSRATRDGKDSGGTFRFTRVWVNRDSGWQTVAFQRRV